MARKRGSSKVIDFDALLALGLIDDAAHKELTLVKAAERAVARDDDWQAVGGEANNWLVEQLKTTPQEMVRVSADECMATGRCRCPEGRNGKTVHYTWKRRPVHTVRQMRLSASGQ